jgi:SH3-like domain-containing protein
MVALVAQAELHAQPQAGSAVIATLPAGTRVKVDPRTIRGRTGDWCYVELRDRNGWVLRSALP